MGGMAKAMATAIKGVDTAVLDKFLAKCYYRSGPSYGSVEAFAALATDLNEWEKQQPDGAPPGSPVANRLYYMAIPPNVFAESGEAIKASGMSVAGWTRLIVEKPFGHDFDSANELATAMTNVFAEEHIYRIDHYLGKEVVQNLMMLRFGNTFLEPLMNKEHISSVTITFKEDFGTQGRGGYFDNYGIIRDIMQNHLMQVLTLVAMEAPVTVAGSGQSGTHIRNAKVQLLRCMEPVKLEDVVVGQYMGDKDNEGYLDDPTVPKGSVTPTYAVAILRICNRRWEGVPFIMKAGKALNERKAEIRIQFKDAPAINFMFPGQKFARNELVMRIQPNEAVYLKCSMKAPGLYTNPITSELDLTYKSRYSDAEGAPDAYTRLILEALRGKDFTFVRSDELLESWRIWTPMLQEMEARKVPPIPYQYGSRGPPEGDELARKAGYVFDSEYRWSAEPQPASPVHSPNLKPRATPRLGPGALPM